MTKVLKDVDIRRSETEARVMKIRAEAEAEARVVENAARMDALRLVQHTKALGYKRLKSALGWSPSQFLSYLKMRSIDAQPSENVIVGVDPAGLTSAPGKS